LKCREKENKKKVIKNLNSITMSDETSENSDALKKISSANIPISKRKAKKRTIKKKKDESYLQEDLNKTATNEDYLSFHDQWIVELGQISSDSRNNFMKQHFPVMYDNLKNYYSHIKMNRERKKKENLSVEIERTKYPSSRNNMFRNIENEDYYINILSKLWSKTLEFSNMGS